MQRSWLISSTSLARVCPCTFGRDLQKTARALGIWEIGRARQIEKVREGRIVVVDIGDGAVASLTGYPIGSEPELIGDDFPALFRLLQELENRALESWYVNVLALYPEYRGKDLARGYSTLRNK